MADMLYEVAPDAMEGGIIGAGIGMLGGPAFSAAVFLPAATATGVANADK